MPIKAIQPSKCPRCGKSVYAAEEMPCGGFKYHKLCFRCSECNKVLATHTVAQHVSDLFCKECYARNFGGQGLGRGTTGKTPGHAEKPESNGSDSASKDRNLREHEDIETPAAVVKQSSVSKDEEMPPKNAPVEEPTTKPTSSPPVDTPSAAATPKKKVTAKK